MGFRVIFKGNHNEEWGIFPVKRPHIPAPLKEIELLSIPGRSGILTVGNQRYEPIVISIDFNFRAKEDEWNEVFRSAKRWLSGSGRLEFSDDSDYFYKVYYVEVKDSERKVKRIGLFTADFYCEPFAYLKGGARKYGTKDVLYNPYFTAHPTYLITGEGVCVLTVNGKSMRANVGQNLTIDTGLMIAYRTDGTMMNTAVTGDYQNLYLQEGDNQISVSSGFQLEIIPNWRAL